MDTSEISVHHTGATLTIQINRSAKRNALTAEMYASMAAALAHAEQDDSIRTVIFSGAGETFCAGNDLADFVARPPIGGDPPVFRFIDGLAKATKILIAAVQGNAVGIGTTMLLHCDFVLAEENAAFQMPFVDLALVPEAASSLLLPNLVGQRRAAELLLLGDRIGARRAVDLGLVTRVVPAGQALPEAHALAARLAQKPAGALRATKILMKSPTRDVQARITEENLAFSAQLQTPEPRAVIARFFEARAKPEAATTGEAA
jgi:enoyl-CoA hydratase/carnithine racemase